jgi:hypothetical protein
LLVGHSPPFRKSKDFMILSIFSLLKPVLTHDTYCQNTEIHYDLVTRFLGHLKQSLPPPDARMMNMTQLDQLTSSRSVCS